MSSSLGWPLVEHVVGGEDGVDSVSRKGQERGFNDAAGGVGGDAGDREDGHVVSDAEGRRFVWSGRAGGDRLSDGGWRRAEDSESRRCLLAHGVVVEDSGRGQVARDVDASQAVRRALFEAEAGVLGERAARWHLQQRRQVYGGRNRGAANRDAQRWLSGGPGVERAPASDVHDLAAGVTNIVALAVDLLNESFALQHGESASQGHRADPVPGGQAGFGREAFARLDAARRDLVA